MDDYPATNLLDGDPSTSWKSDPRDSVDVTLLFEFLQPVYIDTITVSYPSGEGSQGDLGLPIQIEIQTEAGTEYVEMIDADASGFYSIILGSRHRGTLSINLVGEPQAPASDRGSPREVYAIFDIEFRGSVISEQSPESANAAPGSPTDLETVSRLQDLNTSRESMISLIAARSAQVSSLAQLVEQGGAARFWHDARRIRVTTR